MEVIGVIIVLYLLYLLFKHVIIPFISNWLGPILLGIVGIGIAAAFVISIICFIKAIIKDADPYKTYVDKHKNAQGRRNYFFGPGYYSVGMIISDTFSGIGKLVGNIKETVWDIKDDCKFIVWVWPMICFLAFALFTYVFGFFFCAVLSLVLLSLIFTVMIFFFTAFALLWGADRLYLLLKSINCRCPVDKRKFIVPHFKCPNCNSVFKSSLTPGPYGVLHINCPTCRNKLPTTVFNGRSKLDAVCPACGTDFVSGTSSQFGIQCVGNSQAGKTAYIAAFFHELCGNEKHTQIDYKKSPEPLFQKLDAMFNNGQTVQTTDNNAAMYSIVYSDPGFSEFQFSVYDIAGEAFDDIRKENQRQFNYSEGFIYMVSPDEDINDNLDLYSKFVEYLRNTKNINTKKKIDVPIAVVITKADKFKREIDPLGIAIRASSNKELANAPYEEKLKFTRENACKDFLRNMGLANLINLVERDFKVYSYFSVSAMGHEENSGTPFEPRGTLEPAKWIIKQSDGYFYKKLFNRIF